MLNADEYSINMILTKHSPLSGCVYEVNWPKLFMDF